MQYFKRSTMAVLLLMLSTKVFAIDNLTDKQKQNLDLVFEISSGIGNPEIIQAIALKESSAGESASYDKRLSHNRRSYGILQVQVPTARDVLKNNPDLLTKFFPFKSLSEIKDTDLKKLLINNLEANITIGAHVFKWYHSMASSIDTALAGYNMGIYKAVTLPKHIIYKNKYRKDVLAIVNKVVKPFNDQQAKVDVPVKQEQIATVDFNEIEIYNYENDVIIDQKEQQEGDQHDGSGTTNSIPEQQSGTPEI